LWGTATPTASTGVEQVQRLEEAVGATLRAKFFTLGARRWKAGWGRRIESVVEKETNI
jgi:hypothetical protein